MAVVADNPPIDGVVVVNVTPDAFAVSGTVLPNFTSLEARDVLLPV